MNKSIKTKIKFLFYQAEDKDTSEIYDLIVNVEFNLIIDKLTNTAPETTTYDILSIVFIPLNYDLIFSCIDSAASSADPFDYPKLSAESFFEKFSMIVWDPEERTHKTIDKLDKRVYDALIDYLHGEF